MFLTVHAVFLLNGLFNTFSSTNVWIPMFTIMVLFNLLSTWSWDWTLLLPPTIVVDLLKCHLIDFYDRVCSQNNSLTPICLLLQLVIQFMTENFKQQKMMPLLGAILNLSSGILWMDITPSHLSRDILWMYITPSNNDDTFDLFTSVILGHSKLITRSTLKWRQQRKCAMWWLFDYFVNLYFIYFIHTFHLFHSYISFISFIYFIYFLLHVTELSFCFQFFLLIAILIFFNQWWQIIKRNAVLFTKKLRSGKVMMNEWLIMSGFIYFRKNCLIILRKNLSLCPTCWECEANLNMQFYKAPR